MRESIKNWWLYRWLFGKNKINKISKTMVKYQSLFFDFFTTAVMNPQITGLFLLARTAQHW
jgi:hypothetical protein